MDIIRNGGINGHETTTIISPARTNSCVDKNRDFRDSYTLAEQMQKCNILLTFQAKNYFTHKCKNK